ncbi:MAG: hypothetical protein WED09_02335 [Homoserinimonas sp.]
MNENDDLGAQRDARKTAESMPDIDDSAAAQTHDGGMPRDDVEEGLSGGARIDDEELVDDRPPLPGEGQGDPLTENEPTPLEEQVDPDTGLPVRREGYR